MRMFTHSSKLFAVVAGALVIMMATSCAPKELFSEGARVKLEEQGVDLADIQFYNDKEVILRAKVDEQQFSITSGVIKEIDGRKIQEIRIPRYTPCILEKYEEGMLWIRFETGDNKALRFARNSFDKYQIDADKWIQNKGKITYGNKDFLIEPGGNDALLVVKRDKDWKTLTKSRTVNGVRISNKERKRQRREEKQKKKEEKQKGTTARK